MIVVRVREDICTCVEGGREGGGEGGREEGDFVKFFKC